MYPEASKLRLNNVEFRVVVMRDIDLKMVPLCTLTWYKINNILYQLVNTYMNNNMTNNIALK